MSNSEQIISTLCTSAADAPTDEKVLEMIGVLKSGGDVRRRKVRRLRAAVRVRVYENDLKLTIAVDRLLGEL